MINERDVKRLERVTEFHIPDIKSIKGMRNRLVHGYGDVDYDYIADAIFDDLPELENVCKNILNSGKSNK